MVFGVKLGYQQYMSPLGLVWDHTWMVFSLLTDVSRRPLEEEIIKGFAYVITANNESEHYSFVNPLHIIILFLWF